MNRRKFLLTAAATPLLGLPALAVPKEPIPVFWNLEKFEDQVKFLPGELGLVIGERADLFPFICHAARANQMVMPTILIDPRKSITCEEVQVLHTIWGKCKVKIWNFHDELWRLHLYDLKPGTTVFVSNSFYGNSWEEARLLREIAYERKLALIVGLPVESYSTWTGSFEAMRPADLVVSVARDEELNDEYLMATIIKNRNGPNRQTFWYKEKDGNIDRSLATWL
jgi:hypothetical protein